MMFLNKFSQTLRLLRHHISVKLVTPSVHHIHCHQTIVVSIFLPPHQRQSFFILENLFNSSHTQTHAHISEKIAKEGGRREGVVVFS